jgi:hypothetical protein
MKIQDCLTLELKPPIYTLLTPVQTRNPAQLSVAQASRQLFALSWNTNTAGKMPALPQQGAASAPHNFQRIGHQHEWVCALKLHRDPLKRSDF